MAGDDAQDMSLARAVDRRFEDAAEVFGGLPHRWLQVIPGPKERSWRVDTREGLARVRLVITAGVVVAHPDHERWRSFTIQPDPTSPTAFLTAWLTPALDGDLGLVPTGDGTAELRFEGTTESRSWITTSLERSLVGNRLSRSAIDNLLGEIAEHLATAEIDHQPGQTD